MAASSQAHCTSGSALVCFAKKEAKGEKQESCGRRALKVAESSRADNWNAAYLLSASVPCATEVERVNTSAIAAVRPRREDPLKR